MTQSTFYYGCMSSSKTASLLMSAYNYKKKGTKYLIIKPSIDNRSGEDVVSSRIGLSAKADYVIRHDEPYEDAGGIVNQIEKTKAEVILIDECQFLDKDLVKYLCKYTTDNNIVLMAYGLLKNFQGKLFEGSQAWVENADAMREIKTVCERCNRKATFNIRFVDNKPTFDGDEIIIGDEDYHVFCSKHQVELEKNY